MFTFLETGRIYVGSAYDLSKRLKQYYATSWLNKRIIISEELFLQHNHNSFFIPIVEYITGLSLEEARKLILEREDIYLKKIFSIDESNT